MKDYDMEMRISYSVLIVFNAASIQSTMNEHVDYVTKQLNDNLEEIIQGPTGAEKINDIEITIEKSCITNVIEGT